MDKPKRKQKELSSLSIVIGWALIHSLGWTVIYLMASNMANIGSDIFILGFIGVLAGGVTGSLQHTLIERGTGINMTHWILLSALGTSAGLVATTIVDNVWYASPYIWTLPIFLLPALFQWMSIRRFTRAGGLWIVANVIASAVFTMFVITLVSQGYELLSAVIPAGLQGIASGFVVVWLLRQLPKQDLTEEKPKNEYDDHVMVSS